MNTPITLDELFPSNYLRAADIQGEQIFTIKAVEVEMLKNKDTKKDEPKPILYFEEAEKGIVLNKTNKNTLEQLFSTTIIADLIGKRVILHTPDVEGFGKVAPAIRIKAQKPPADHVALLKHYSSLFEKAKAAKVDGIENYVVPANVTDLELLQLGKELKEKIEAAELFA
jgi:hypothetical protein